MVKENTSKKKILPSAKKVFLEKGTTGARMQDIADEAGINKAILHYYFRNKEKLFDVIFKQSSALFFPKISGIIQSEISLFEKIEKFCTAYIDMLCKNSGKTGKIFLQNLQKIYLRKLQKEKSLGSTRRIFF
jgi:AcrR family transcriptional regulator